MKKIFSLLLILTFSHAFAQVQKLREFSSGNFIDSRIVYEENREDVFGYFLLYEIDRQSKEIYDMEYIILDKNLNKITSGIFTQSVYKHFLMKTGARLTFVKKIKNEIFFGLHDNLKHDLYVDTKIESDFFHERYRKINLDDFTFSKEFVFKNSEPIDNDYKSGDSFKISDLEDNQSIYPTNSEYFVIFASSEYKAPSVQFGGINYLEKIKTTVKSFSVTDSDFNILWSKEINFDKKDLGVYRYRASDATTLILQKKIVNKKIKELRSYELYELASGKFIGEISEKDPNYKMSQFKLKFSGDKIFVYNYLYELRDKNYEHEKTLGYARLIFDKNSGKELKRDYLLWENLGQHITFKGKFGEIPKYGKLHFQDFIQLENGNTIAVAEGYTKARNSKVLDFYLMEFNTDMKVKHFRKVEKTTNISKYELTGQQIYNRRDFDFYYSQKMDEDDNYVFLYSNNEKEGNSLKRKKSPSWVLGIVTYVDGEFNVDKLQLTTEDGMIMPMKAKNGSILLQEYSEKNGMEMRLEKINF